MRANRTTGAQPDGVADRGPADQYRHRAGGTADDDVLPGSPLEPEGVDEDVEEGGADGQHGRKQVDRHPQLDEGHHLEGDGEDQGRGRARPRR